MNQKARQRSHFTLIHKNLFDIRGQPRLSGADPLTHGAGGHQGSRLTLACFEGLGERQHAVDWGARGRDEGRIHVYGIRSRL